MQGVTFSKVGACKITKETHILHLIAQQLGICWCNYPFLHTTVGACGQANLSLYFLKNWPILHLTFGGLKVCTEQRGNKSFAFSVFTNRGPNPAYCYADESDSYE